MELLTGLLFAYSYFIFGFQLELITAILFISLLVIISVSDIAYMLIPNKFLIFFTSTYYYTNHRPVKPMV